MIIYYMEKSGLVLTCNRKETRKIIFRLDFFIIGVPNYSHIYHSTLCAAKTKKIMKLFLLPYIPYYTHIYRSTPLDFKTANFSLAVSSENAIVVL